MFENTLFKNARLTKEKMADTCLMTINIFADFLDFKVNYIIYQLNLTSNSKLMLNYDNVHNFFFLNHFLVPSVLKNI